MATKALYILPVQTDRGVFLRVTFDGKEYEPVGPLQSDLGFVVPVEVDDPDPYTVKKKSGANRQRQRSIRQENLIARDISGNRQPGSGALPRRKGDVVLEGKMRIEAKYTKAASYRLELATMNKIAAEAKPGELPTVVVEFIDNRSETTLEKLAIVYYSDWKRLAHNADGDDRKLPRRERRRPGSGPQKGNESE